MVGNESPFSGLSPAAPLRVNIREAVQIPSLKRDQISAQGFNPGLGNSRRCARKGYHSPARHIGQTIIRVPLFNSRHFQGAFSRCGHPGLKPLAELFRPFGTQTLYPSLMLTRMCSDGRDALPRVRRCTFRRYISMLCPPLAELRPFANSFGPFQLRTFLGHAKPDRRGSASLPLTTSL